MTTRPEGEYYIDQINPETQERQEVFKGTFEAVTQEHYRLIAEEIKKVEDSGINPHPYYWLYTKNWYQIGCRIKNEPTESV